MKASLTINLFHCGSGNEWCTSSSCRSGGRSSSNDNLPGRNTNDTSNSKKNGYDNGCFSEKEKAGNREIEATKTLVESGALKDMRTFVRTAEPEVVRTSGVQRAPPNRSAGRFKQQTTNLILLRLLSTEIVAGATAQERSVKNSLSCVARVRNRVVWNA
ncbi:unnamed protein product [Heterotrigona itama]|uniref:Uncharacterized protein n=1 Tax=Heterotrigona itama TaxID=395501 RepID=A0A6V7GRV0_9HYME|nr:unnamed protein product [Heterotrigona itama]